MKNKIVFISLFFLFLLKSVAVEAQDTSIVVQFLAEAKMEKNADLAYQKYLSIYTLSRQVNYQEGLFQSLPFLAEKELEQGNTAAALRYHLEELDLLKKRDLQHRIKEIEISIGNIYFGEKLYAEALPYYKAAYQKKLEEGRDEQDLEHKLGDAYAELLQPDSAYIYYAQFPNWDEKGHAAYEEQLNALYYIVEAYNKAKEYEKAVAFNKRILEKMTSRKSEASSLYLIYNNLGYNYNFLKKYPEAIEHFKQAIDLGKATNYEEQAILYSNIGIAYFNLGQFAKSIEALSRANKLLQKIDKAEESQINHLMSNVYLGNKDLYNALNFNGLAIKNAKKHQLTPLLSDAYYTAAQIYVNLYEYETALDYFQLHLSLSDSLKQVERERQQDLLQGKIALEKADKEIRLLLINQEVKDLTIQQLNLEKEKQSLAFDKLTLEKDQQQKALVLLQQEQEVKEARIKNQALEARQAQQQLQITQQQLRATEQEKELAALAQQEKLNQLDLQRQEAQIEADKQKVALLEQENEINQLELAQQENFRQFVYGLGGLGLIVLGLILAGLLYSRRTNRKLAQKNAAIEAQKNEIIAERNKSDALLLNILPAFTAQELKEKGRATPRKYENATVLFADFVNFTGISAQMSPEKLVEELNYCFQAFDEIVKEYNLEKIKTIGDAYMCVGGLPIPNSSHPQNAAKAAIAMMDFIQNRYKEKKALGENYWQMRIGLHSGPVVAGVVGSSKFVYDIWGDTVNTASRMESNSQAFKINLSGRTYELLNQHFNCNYRGKIKAKNKGEIDMYFLEERLS